MLGKQKINPGEAFGIALRKLRIDAGLSQEALAFEAGIQRNFVSLIELGHNQPTVTTVFKLADALSIKPSRLVQLAENELISRR
jgi:transcriptional regulator with XRE-family HTH domain